MCKCPSKKQIKKGNKNPKVWVKNHDARTSCPKHARWILPAA